MVTLTDSSGKTIQTVASEPSSSNGIFISVFDPMPASFDKYTITAKSGSLTATLNNILFGDVIVCSGQSNMQFTVDQAFNASEEIKDANNYPNIRLFTAPLTCSTTPLDELISVEEPWSVASEHSVGGGNWSYFSATCWFFGKNLYQTLQYPIGLIGTDYGGKLVFDMLLYMWSILIFWQT